MMGNVEPSLPVGQIDIFPMETSRKPNNDEELQKEEDFHCTAYDEQSSLSINAKNFFTCTPEYEVADRFDHYWESLLNQHMMIDDLFYEHDNFEEETIQKEAMTFPSQDLSNEDEDDDNFIQNGACGTTRKRCQHFHPMRVVLVFSVRNGWCSLRLLRNVAKFDIYDRFYPGDSIAYFPLLELEETTSNVRAAKDEPVKIQEETIQKEAMTFPSQDLSNKDEDNDNFIQNKASLVSQRRHKQFHPTRATTVLLLRKKWIWVFLAILTGLLQVSYASNTVECPTEQHVREKGRAVIKCDGLEEFPFIYWYNNTNEDATAFIEKVNGEVAGTGYTTGEFDIDNEGSLVIHKVEIRDKRTFRVRVLDSALRGSSYDITLIVYVEPAEPLPVIPECSGQSTCILKRDSERVISCIHGESRPAMEVSWFLRDGRQDLLLNATVNQRVSADSLTFTTSAELVMNKIPTDANMNQLLVLVCKSSLPIPGMKGSERQILLDSSVDVPLTNEDYLDPVYAIERQENLMIKCRFNIDTRNNVVLWMYKSLNSEKFEYILYSAYGEVTFTPEGFNLTDDGALVIKEVHIQYEGYYACVGSSENTAVSFVQNLEVIVVPKPPRIVVKGCKPFQPCHLAAQEAKTITCTVNGVHPQVDLSIVTYSMNVAVTKTTTTSHKEDGLFYYTIEGGVDVSESTCEENVTVVCQARGPAAYSFMSDAYIMVSVDGDKCAGTSTDMVPCNDGSGNYDLDFSLLAVVLVLVFILTVTLISVIIMRRRIYRSYLECISRHGSKNEPI